MSEPFLLGVNYWPRRKAMYWWTNFDAAEVREEFALIAELGMKIVRIFLRWEDFQPAPESVSEPCLTNLTTVCDIAVENGLKLDVTFFTGHMSGPNWCPPWLMGGDVVLPPGRQLMSGDVIVTGGYRNPYVDPVALDAQRLLLRTVVTRLKDHAAVWMWNLGNEPDLFAHPPTNEIGQAWVREMTRLIRSIDSAHLVTCGLHVASLNENNGLRVDQVFAECDLAVMHAYPMYASWARQPLDPDVVPYTSAVTAALSGKPILMEEFGGCTVGPGEPSEVWEWSLMGTPRTQFMASEEDLARYIDEVLPRLVEIGAVGAFLWCYADYVPELWDKPPCSEYHHERFFGLVRPDGTVKPHAYALQRFSRTNPTVRTENVRRAEVDVTPDEYYEDPSGHLTRLYAKYIGR